MTEAETLIWKHGYLVACCNLQSMFDRPTIAADVLGQASISEADIEAMDLCEYDKLELAKIRADGRRDPISSKPQSLEIKGKIMNRELTGHRVNPANDVLKIEVLDGPGSGGANHLYHITGFDSVSNPSDPWTKRHGESAKHSTILFQNGPIAEAGVNGVTHEVLLAVLIDRLEAFQAGRRPLWLKRNAVIAAAEQLI